MEKQINLLGKMVTDTSYVNQPKGTTTFVLNGVNETEDGNLSNRFSEEANEEYFKIPEGFIPLGKTSVNNEQSVVFYGDGVNSVIMLETKNIPNASEIIFDDRNQIEKMGFSINKQVDVLFRLRRGCERTLYWVDPKPRQFNFDRKEKYKNDLGEWEISAFSLQRRPKQYPVYDEVTVLNSGGSLLSGSYNFLIQYLDEDFNPSEILSPTECVNVYANNTQREYREIRGSSNVGSSYYALEATTKAVRIRVSNIDTSYPFYRIVIVEATSATGLPTAVKYSNEISTSNGVFVYTGNNFSAEGSTEELLEIQDYIDEARHIEQIDNMLILGDTKGSDIPFCTLQKYFSQVLTDVQAKTVFLSENLGANCKNPTAKLEGLGYMPREIYSVGAVLVFEDNVQSPVYHIPGKSSVYPKELIFQSGVDVYPMDLNNESETEQYTENGDCEDFWGKDANGDPLLGSPVRHHRFPSRGDINLPLVEEVLNPSSVETGQLNVKISISGELEIPECPVEDPDCDEDALIASLEDILFEIVYQDEDGNTYTFIEGISFYTWDEDGTYGQVSFTPPLSTGLITIVSITEIAGVVTTDVSGGVESTETGLTYTTVVEASTFSTKNRVFKTQVMGFKFSNINIPAIEETAGKKVTGIFFVRNERTEDQMTVVDSGVLVPCLQASTFVSQGLLCPELANQDDPRLNKKYFGLINPRFKFFGATYDTFSSIERDGSFEITQRNKSRFRVEDIVDGTTYNKSRHKRSEKDDDGWDLHVRTRHNETTFSFAEKGLFADGSDIEDVFYLPALSSKLVDEGGTKKEVFNLASDNRIGIVQKVSLYTDSFLTKIPYVSLLINNANPYANFRSLSYYKIHENYFEVKNGDTNLSFSVFGGDTYVAPMAYTNSVFYEDKARRRRTKSGALAIVVGVVLVAAAIVISVVTLGIGAVAIAALAGALVGLGGTLLASGISQEAFNRVYRELYNKGLRKTVLDEFTELFNTINPPDDEFEWVGDSIDLWFETTVNTGLRQGSNNSVITDFIDAPSLSVTGNDTPLAGYNTVPPVTLLDNHMFLKLTYLDFERKKANRGYFGYAQPELYDLNQDYMRHNKQKAYFALPIEYDCCSDCTEEFPHRVYHSLQSFDEELTDNYRVFLPNNYKDIEGNTGRIRDIFRIGNNLYIHTQHALWHLPQNFQERVTGEILSFIGTGSYFSLPPRKIVDDQNNSAGTQHKWGRVKTPYGVAFPSAIEGTWFLFNGENLQPLSDEGMSNTFRELMQFRRLEGYESPIGLPFRFNDNPSNPLGIGFVSVYDTEKKRLILTKKDNLFNQTEGSEYCYSEGQVVEFENIQDTIDAQGLLGWEFIGIENCKLKFKKIEEVVETRTGTTIQQVPNDAYIYIFPDYTGSFDTGQRADLVEAIETWYEDFRPEDVAKDFLVVVAEADIANNDNDLERWVLFPKIVTEHATFNGKALIISLINEASSAYHGNGIADPVVGQPTATYIADRLEFINFIRIQFEFFVGVNYTIATDYGVTPYSYSKAHIQQSLLAINGVDFTQAEIDALPLNSILTNVTEVNNLKSTMADNPYSFVGGLKDYGWIGKYDRNDLAELAGTQDSIITPEQFAQDLNGLLASIVTEEDYEYEVTTLVTTYQYIEPDAVIEPPFIDKSWTISYSLKEQGFISFHSWTPSFYLGETNAFFSWKDGLASLYRHNVKGTYLNFYGEPYSFIVEKVENQSPTTEKITDFISWQSIVEIWDADKKQYIEQKDITFNRLLVYNSYQINGMVDLIVKTEDEEYFSQQITDEVGQSLVNRSERTWFVNDLRDMRSSMDEALFTKSDILLPTDFIDKVVNPSAIDFNKAWYEMEPFRDKYLVVRYIFDSFVVGSEFRIGIYFDSADTKISER